MAIGTSGRIVVEIEPELKRQIYEALDRDGLTLKEWFLGEAMKLLSHGVQFSLDFGEEQDQVAPTRQKSRGISPEKKAKE